MNYSFTPVLLSDSIGDSRSTMNANYSAIDAWTTNIQLSAQNYWIPLMNYYNSVKSNLQNNINNGNLFKSNWDSMTTTVKTNSSRWIEPLILFYPEKIKLKDLNGDQITNNKFQEINLWLSQKFSIIDEHSNTLYVDNQKAYVYLIKEKNQNAIHSVKRLLQSASCYTTNQTQCVQCTTSLVGYVYCSNGNVNCSGSVSCPHCETVPCYYLQTNNYKYDPKIEAWINLFYKDLAESTDISCLKYVVKNCNWNFLDQI
jgi:hypothetical protein